tara:strand:+ start:343 stop:1098 length:756 start_codon:yes stop_codon:yes gene_type:complete
MNDWIINEKDYFLQSRLLLEKGFKHAFFTKKPKQNFPRNLVRVFSLDYEIYILKQVHSNIVIETKNINSKDSKEADGLISEVSKRQSLWIYTADCIPILFADTKNGRVAACHAGWKGIAKNIINKTLEKLNNLGSKRKDLIVAIGPAISGLNYKVDTKVVSTISNSMKRENIDKNNELEELGIVKAIKNSNELLLDIRMAASVQLQNEGIKKNQISINRNCTFEDKKLFSSWRRDKRRDSQWSVILSRTYS